MVSFVGEMQVVCSEMFRVDLANSRQLIAISFFVILNVEL